jgi:hypothetical protein
MHYCDLHSCPTRLLEPTVGVNGPGVLVVDGARRLAPLLEWPILPFHVFLQGDTTTFSSGDLILANFLCSADALVFLLLLLCSFDWLLQVMA